MKLIKEIVKDKIRRIYKLDNLEELDKLKFTELFPKDCKNVEINLTTQKGEIIMYVDYLTKLDISNK